MIKRGRLNKYGYLSKNSIKKINPHGVYCPVCYSECTNVYEIAAMLSDINIKTPCENCTHRFTITEAHIRPEEQEPMQTWFHATHIDNSDWLTCLRERGIIAHIGTEQAAMDRGITEYARQCNQPFLLYEVCLTPGTRIDPTLYNDEDGNDNSIKHYDGVRYVNRFEDTASISLAMHPDNIDVVDCTRISCYTACRSLSIYNMEI